MGKSQLLPCPFCGKSDFLVERLDNSASVVICQGMVDERSACLARGPVGLQDDDGEEQPGYAASVREWNKRVQQSASVEVPDEIPRVIRYDDSVPNGYRPPKAAPQPASVVPNAARTKAMQLRIFLGKAGHVDQAIIADELIDLLGAADPQPVSGDLNPEHTLFNEIRASMPVNEDDEPTRYIITEAQLQRIRSMEFGQHPVSGEQRAIHRAPDTCNGKRCGWCNDGAEACKYSPLQRQFRDDEQRAWSALGEQPVAPAAKDVAGLVEALEEIIKQYPSPNIPHVDYRVHACRHAEVALNAYRAQRQCTAEQGE